MSGNLRVIPAISIMPQLQQTEAQQVFTTPEFIFTLRQQWYGKYSQAPARLGTQLPAKRWTRAIYPTTGKKRTSDLTKNCFAELSREAKHLGVDMAFCWMTAGSATGNHCNDHAGLGGIRLARQKIIVLYAYDIHPRFGKTPAWRWMPEGNIR